MAKEMWKIILHVCRKRMDDARAASRHHCVEATMKAAVTSSDFARHEVPILCSSNQLSRSQAESFLTSLNAR